MRGFVNLKKYEYKITMIMRHLFIQSLIVIACLFLFSSICNGQGSQSFEGRIVTEYYTIISNESREYNSIDTCIGYVNDRFELTLSNTGIMDYILVDRFEGVLYWKKNTFDDTLYVKDLKLKPIDELEIVTNCKKCVEIEGDDYNKLVVTIGGLTKSYIYKPFYKLDNRRWNLDYNYGKTISEILNCYPQLTTYKQEGGTMIYKVVEYEEMKLEESMFSLPDHKFLVKDEGGY